MLCRLCHSKVAGLTMFLPVDAFVGRVVVCQNKITPIFAVSSKISNSSMFSRVSAGGVRNTKYIYNIKMPLWRLVVVNEYEITMFRLDN